jgi:hypothetical protein
MMERSHQQREDEQRAHDLHGQHPTCRVTVAHGSLSRMAA